MCLMWGIKDNATVKIDYLAVLSTKNRDLYKSEDTFGVRIRRMY